jgi:ribosomal protein S18 acetylase RimI-like enzyme
MSTPDTSLLDNPIWNSLVTEHSALAQGDDNARRYPPEIGPLAGIPAPSPAAFDSLRQLAGDGIIGLLSLGPIQIPPGWKVLREGPLVQMIRSRAGQNTDVDAPSMGTSSLFPGMGFTNYDGSTLRQLTAGDAPAMVDLAHLTEPGPFSLRTMELGNFYGIFYGDRLVSMAGKRMHVPGLQEVSGVCTHPDARGRGYARELMSIVIDEIEREGKTAFLHMMATNPAIRLYEQLGFSIRRQFQFVVLAVA